MNTPCAYENLIPNKALLAAAEDHTKLLLWECRTKEEFKKRSSAELKVPGGIVGSIVLWDTQLRGAGILSRTGLYDFTVWVTLPKR